MSDTWDKKYEILRAASGLFRRFGFSKTSMKDIAKAASMGKGSVYYYFSSKEEIFVEVVKVFMDEFFDQLRDLVDAAETFEEKFKVYLQTPVRLMKDNVMILAEVLRNLPVQHMRKIESFRNENKERLKGILKEILDFGIAQNLLSESLPYDRYMDIINDWFLIGDDNLEIVDKEKLIQKIIRDHEWIIQIILYGIIKRG